MSEGADKLVLICVAELNVMPVIFKYIHHLCLHLGTCSIYFITHTWPSTTQHFSQYTKAWFTLKRCWPTDCEIPNETNYWLLQVPNVPEIMASWVHDTEGKYIFVHSALLLKNEHWVSCNWFVIRMNYQIGSVVPYHRLKQISKDLSPGIL